MGATAMIQEVAAAFLAEMDGLSIEERAAKLQRWIDSERARIRSEMEEEAFRYDDLRRRVEALEGTTPADAMYQRTRAAMDRIEARLAEKAESEEGSG